MLSFDQLLLSRVGLGKYQYIMSLQIGLMNFISGMQIIGISIIVRVLDLQWQLTKSQIITVTSTLFIGAFFGQSFNMFFGDRMGRKRMLVSQVFLAAFCFIGIGTTSNFQIMTLLWFLNGFSWVTLMILSNIVMPEIIIQSQRGVFMLFAQILTVLGILYQILICILIMGSLDSPYWRLVMIVDGMLCLVLGVLMVFYFEESPRFQLCSSYYTQAFESINRMIIGNNSGKLLESEEKDQLIQWQKKEMNKQLETNQVIQIFQHPYLSITVMLCLSGMLYMCQVNGLLFLLPFFYGEESQGLWILFLNYCLEIPLSLISFKYIDLKQYGRVKIYIFALTMIGLADFAIFTFGKNALFYGIILMKLFERVVWSCIFLLGSESYSTILRTTGSSAVGAFGKGCMMFFPSILFGLYHYSEYLPFLFMGIACIINIAILSQFPDKTSQPLDDDTF